MGTPYLSCQYCAKSECFPSESERSAIIEIQVLPCELCCLRLAKSLTDLVSGVYVQYFSKVKAKNGLGTRSVESCHDNIDIFLGFRSTLTTTYLTDVCSQTSPLKKNKNKAHSSVRS